MHRDNLRLAALAACLLAVGGCKCNGAPTREGLKPEGVPCAIDAQCETGLCDALPKADKLCMRKCSQECRATELCTQLGPERFGCVPEREGLCKACTTSGDCPYLADACLSLGEGKFCGRDCSYDDKCPPSYQCVEGTGVNGTRVASQCVPISGSCLCTASTTGQTLPCEKNNDAGTCVGVRTCDPPGEYSACSAAVPLEEACNGADDDCDGQDDEELGETQCGVGECVRTFANCANGAPQACVPADAGVELCDGKDNDCDGVNDNGFELVVDLPDDAIADTNCDGIDGQLAKAYFVDCGGGSDSAAGTMSAPFATLAHALSVASAGGKDQILVTGTCTESVTLKEGVGLYGGYSSTFTRSLATPATVSQLSGGGPAVSGTNLSQSTALDAFVVVAAPGSGISGSSVGIQLTSSPGAKLSNLDVRAGAGAAGAAGSDGTAGGSGGPGGAGEGGTSDGSSGGGPGAPGTGACGTGGAAGQGGYNKGNGTNGSGGSLGACGGSFGRWGYCSTCSSCGGPMRGADGSPGCDGANGSAGASGTGGSGAGAVVSGQFTPGGGGDGAPGNPGGSGGGGAGGGGGAADCCASVIVCACASGCNADRGGGGGAGGAPGCGGGRGTGGGGGGASIGVLLIDSSPELRASRISTGSGGAGGRGGSGAFGGSGGSGGPGGSKADDSGAGGAGGRGGNGGNGGSGAGGGGGPSVGIYKSGTSAPTVASTTFTLGAGGQGGPGGSGAPAGSAGVAQNVYP